MKSYLKFIALAYGAVFTVLALSSCMHDSNTSPPPPPPAPAPPSAPVNQPGS